MIRKNQYTILTYNSVEGYTVKEKTFLGKKFLVVPVVMMVEGVHNGSRGPLLHTIAELGKYPASWDGRPVVVDHPQIDGVNVSANDPEIVETRKVGEVYHTTVKDKKLTAEAWLEEERLRQVSTDALVAVQNSEPLEVSIGVFSDEDEIEGEWNGEQYNAVAKNHRPDHLALLPGGVGACSIEDGCGIRANRNNKKGGEDEMIRLDKMEQTIKSVKEQGYALLDIIDNTSAGLMERLEAVRRKIDSLDTNDSYHFVHEVYDDYVVYESRLRVGESKIYKQGYSFNSGVVELTGDPVEVHKKVEYVVNNKRMVVMRTKPIKNKEDNEMAENKCPKCVAKINDLISNKESGFVEADREWLDTLSEVALDKIVPKTNTKEVIKEKIVEVNKLTPAQEADLAFVANQRAEKRSELITGIKTNSKDLWSDADLNVMTEVQLDKLFKSVKKEEEVDYSVNGMSGDLSVNTGEIEPMLPNGVEIETVK